MWKEAFVIMMLGLLGAIFFLVILGEFGVIPIVEQFFQYTESQGVTRLDFAILVFLGITLIPIFLIPIIVVIRGR